LVIPYCHYDFLLDIYDAPNTVRDINQGTVSDVLTGMSRAYWMYNYEYDAAANQLAYDYNTGGLVIHYDFKYRDVGKGLQVAQHTGITPDGTLKNGSVTNIYDANGNLQSVDDRHTDDGVNKDRTFLLNNQGQIIRKTHTGDGNKRQFYVYSNGNGVASYGDLADKDIDFNYSPISDHYPGATAGSYTVSSSSDTLNSIALMVWGDSSLWYLIADANGLTSDSALSVGQTLVIPNNVSNIRNATDTFKPYNPGQIIGDTTPTMPIAPPPKEDGGGCSAAQIIVIIIVIVASIFTAGAALAAAGATFGTIMSTGAAFFAGSAGFSLTTVAVGFAAGAVGSIVGQAAGMALGIQDEFSWGDVAVGGVTGAVTAGMGGWSKPAGDLAKAGTIVAKGAISYTANYAANKAVGNDVTFRWSDVAANVAASAVMSQVGKVDTQSVALQTIQDGLRGTVSGILTRELKRTFGHAGKQSDEVIAMNAFGQAVGNSIGRVTQKTYAEEFKKERAEKLKAARESKRQEQAEAAELRRWRCV